MTVHLDINIDVVCYNKVCLKNKPFISGNPYQKRQYCDEYFHTLSSLSRTSQKDTPCHSKWDVGCFFSHLWEHSFGYFLLAFTPNAYSEGILHLVLLPLMQLTNRETRTRSSFLLMASNYSGTCCLNIWRKKTFVCKEVQWNWECMCPAEILALPRKWDHWKNLVPHG